MITFARSVVAKCMAWCMKCRELPAMFRENLCKPCDAAKLEQLIRDRGTDEDEDENVCQLKRRKPQQSTGPN
jgi:hypothetical protein